MNYDFGRFIEHGEELEAPVELAARCIMGHEFELMDEADRPRVDAALRVLTGDAPTADATPTGQSDAPPLADPDAITQVEAPTGETAADAIPDEPLSISNDDAPSPTAPADDTPAESNDPDDSTDPSEPQPLDPSERHSTR
ncbi:MAG: hypothetical protein HZA51_15650 [Planctomycetes bacterium]|nr:hypothetical protein [Planctomycetota bacterium]